MAPLLIIKQWSECLLQINSDYLSHFLRDRSDCWNGTLLSPRILVSKLMPSLQPPNFPTFQFKDRYIEAMKTLRN